jgi:hypothetical protein
MTTTKSNLENHMNTINHHLLLSTAAIHTGADRQARRAAASVEARRSQASERGEGVISVALAVLIMAGIAGLMWVAYKTMIDNANKNVAGEVEKLGKP